jgi:phage gpG-like protein
MADIFDTLAGITRLLQSAQRRIKAGEMAVGMIQSHLYKGEGWSPLSPATAAYRKPGRPLQDTGALRDSITFELVDEDTISIGTTKPYAALQNNGGTIRAKKQWLWIPGPDVRELERRYGWGPTNVLRGLKAAGYLVFRRGRTMCYRIKGSTAEEDIHVAYYLKKSVEIPKREFFYLTDAEIEQIAREVGVDSDQL